MAQKVFQTLDETIGYATAPAKQNTDPRYLVAGSKNVLIDRQRKVVIRHGNKRLGAGSSTQNPIKNQQNWKSSNGQEWLMQNHSDELEVFVGSLDGVDINAWHRIKNGFDVDEIIRFAVGWWKDTENIDVTLMVAGDANIYEWSGAVAIVASATANTITKKGTTTFGQARFFANANLTLINTRTGTEFTYTGGLDTLTLTGVTGDTSELQANDVLVQKVVTHTNEPATSRNNHTIDMYDNQILVGSNDDSEYYMSSNTDFTDTTFSSPRIAGEGGIFTLDGPARGAAKLGSQLVLFAGDDSVYRVLFKEVAVSTTLAEILDVKKIPLGSNRGCLSPDTIVPLGDSIIYLSAEPALRYIQDPEQLSGLNPKTLSNPIKPDFDAETWTNAQAHWFKNAIYLTAPTTGRTYILEFVEDADGRTRRFWQPPQTLNIRSITDYDDKLYGGSNQVQETHELFESTSFSDMIANGTHGDPDDKVAIPAVAAYAYNDFGDTKRLKTFDEYFVEGEISQNTDLEMNVFYDFGGATGEIVRIIEGSDTGILEETLINGSLGQAPLGQNPLGGVLDVPTDAAVFGVTFEIAREDFRKIQAIFSVEKVDAYFAISAHGPNAQLSRRRNLGIIR